VRDRTEGQSTGAVRPPHSVPGTVDPPIPVADLAVLVRQPHPPRPPLKRNLFFFSSRRRHTRWPRDWSSDVCSSDLACRRDMALLHVGDGPAARCDRLKQVQHVMPYRGRYVPLQVLLIPVLGVLLELIRNVLMYRDRKSVV